MATLASKQPDKTPQKQPQLSNLLTTRIGIEPPNKGGTIGKETLMLLRLLNG
jgi:hypothetical protein